MGSWAGVEGGVKWVGVGGRSSWDWLWNWKATLWSLWILRIELRCPGLLGKRLKLLSHLVVPVSIPKGRRKSKSNFTFAEKLKWFRALTSCSLPAWSHVGLLDSLKSQFPAAVAGEIASLNRKIPNNIYNSLGPGDRQWEWPTSNAAVSTLTPSQPKPECLDTFVSCVHEVYPDAPEQSAE